jgi:hypothetical protein
VSGFTYALALALVSGNVLPGSFAFASFVLPMGIGLWIASQDVPRTLAIQRVTRVLFAATTVSSIYGIVQYVALPPWDAFWLNNLDASAGGAALGGRAEAFAVRVFGTFSSAGPFGTFLACMLLLSLPYLSTKRPWLLVQVATWLAALALTSLRTGWLMFALGVAVYILLATNRGTVLAAVTACCIAVFGGSALMSSSPGSNQFMTHVAARLQTFNDLSGDRSANARLDVYAEGFGEFASEPLGRGLGTVGLATKLSAAERTIPFDSGILARMIEMGAPGALFLLAAFVTSFAALLSVWARAWSRDPALQNAAAVAIAMLLAIHACELSVDISGLLTLVLWLNVSLALLPQGVAAPALAGRDSRQRAHGRTRSPAAT